MIAAMEAIFSVTYYHELDGRPLPVAYAWGPPDRGDEVRAEASLHLSAYRANVTYTGPTKKREVTFPALTPLDIVRGGHRTPPRLRRFAERSRLRRLGAAAILAFGLALGCSDASEWRECAERERALYDAIARYYRWYVD